MLDLKGHYRGTPVDVETDPDLYRAVAEAFPEAYLEDPDLNEETRPVLEPHIDRVTWDAPLHSLADITGLERAPKAINSKPSRFGSLRELLSIYEHCEREGIAVYGGGQGEIGPGRGQIQYLASLFHHDTPNDVAPSGYNDPAVPDGMPSSPMEPVPSANGFPLGRVGCRAMAESKFVEALNEQVGNEFAASQQYIAIAVHYDAETLPQLASFFYRQAVEERNHAMMIIQYLLDADHDVRDARGRGAAGRLHRHGRSGQPRARAGEAGLRPDRQPGPASPARRATTRASSSCSGSSRSRSRRSPRWRRC